MAAHSVITRSLWAGIGVAVLIAVAGCSFGGGSNRPSPAPSTAAPVLDTSPCAGPNGVGGKVPAGVGPGDLVAAVDLTEANSGSLGFPTGARVWRVLYVTTGVDETDLQLVCGMVASSADGPRLFGSTGRLVNRTHGTVGISQSCLPSSNPASLFWGPTPGGMNAVSWGSLFGAHKGDAAGGMLQSELDAGMLVTATDYFPDTSYVVGKMEASAALDIARAGTQLMLETFTQTAPESYDMVIWGHSQGGHGAIWAGQLAESYLAAMHPVKPTAAIRLVGVAALAPASNFITLPDQPGVAPGDGLADWEMHQNAGLDLPIQSVQLQIGPALVSYIFGSWSQLAAGVAPGASAAFPAYPVSPTALELSTIVTPTPGMGTVSSVEGLCLTGAEAKQVKAVVEPYENAKLQQMLVPPVWNLPADYTTPGQYFKGGLDTTCATTADTGIVRWCDWLRFNLPGPLGINPYPKAPIVAGAPVPLFIAQGSADNVVHCISPVDTPSDVVPGPADCMARALYDSLADAEYCPAGAARGHLELNTVRMVPFTSPATHLSLPGEVTARSLSKDPAELVFAGSPLDTFITAAFDGTTTPGCSLRVLNPAN